MTIPTATRDAGSPPPSGAKRRRLAIVAAGVVAAIAAAAPGTRLTPVDAAVGSALAVDPTGRVSPADPTGPALAADGTLPAIVATGQTSGYIGNDGAMGDGNLDDGDLIRGRLPRFGPPFGMGSESGVLGSPNPGTQSASRLATPIETQAGNVVTDLNTGLMWIRVPSLLDERDGEGAHGNVVLAEPLSWQAAIDAANALDYAGHDDWRLPNANELSTVVDFGRIRPSLDPVAFPEPLDAMPSPYAWSSTTNDAFTSEAFYVNMYDGHMYPWHKAIEFMARPVRDAVAEDPVPILQTGQRQGFQGNEGGYGAANRDDGDLQRGVAPAYAWADDGTIDEPGENVALDSVTRMEWLRDPLLLTGSAGSGGAAVAGNVDLSQPVSWQAAVTACRDLDYAGHDDWRLPNIRELTSIVQPGRPDGPLDPATFPNVPLSPNETPMVWWSSTTAASEPVDAQFAGSQAWYQTTGAPAMRHHVRPEFVPQKASPGYARCARDEVGDSVPELYRAEVRSSADWTGVSVESHAPGLRRVGKFILPVDSDDPDAPFDLAVQDVNKNPLHYDFLRAAFPELFGWLTFADYTAMVSPRATRTYLAGALSEFTNGAGERVYGFEVTLDSDAAPDLLSQSETEDVFLRLSSGFRRRPLVYSPSQAGARAEAAGWQSATFAIQYPETPPDATYEAYTTGDAYGVVRFMSLDELAEAEAEGRLSWKDILVLDGAPTDIESVVAGIVTGARQGELSHLAIRAAARGTANTYVADPRSQLGAYEGTLIRLSVTRDGLFVKHPVSHMEAEAWWAAVRPAPIAIPAADTVFSALDGMVGIGSDDQDGRATTRFGAKAANLARLYRFLSAEYQVPGIAIPFHYYQEFISGSPVTDPRAQPPSETTIALLLDSLHDDPVFVGDSQVRAALLEHVRDAAEDRGVIPESTVQAIAARLDEVFGPNTMVRFRSSSNAEDGLEFNGAGLYDSTSVCAADSRDSDTLGPSRCDPNQAKERTIERGLARVWASLWNFRAWEERSYYGIDQVKSSMAILVTPAFPDERANGVAFSGNPLAPGAPEYVVNVQQGDVSVVLPDPGVLPERDVLGLTNGQVTSIRRVRESTLVAPGTHVMSDAELHELGDVIGLASERFPVARGEHDPEEILLDLEFKLRRGDDQLIVKQIRPFLAVKSGSRGRASALRIEVPAALRLCAMWRMTEPISKELDQKATLDVTAGEFTIALDSPQSPEVFGDLRFGPHLVPASPKGPTWVEYAEAESTVRLRRSYVQDGQTVTVTWQIPGVRGDELNVRRVDADYVTTGVNLTVEFGPDSSPRFLAPCGLGHLGAERLTAVFADGGRAVFDLRKGSGGGFWAGYLWADLVRADVRLAGDSRVVSDHAHLVYDAERHNWNERLWVLFDPPLGDAHGLELAQTFLGGGEERFTATTLDGDHRPLTALDVLTVTRTAAPAFSAVLLPDLRR